MAITATIAVNPSSITSPQQQATVTLTISNSLSTTVQVTGVVPTAAVHSGTNGSVPVLLGQPPIGPGMPLTVPATGTNLVMTWSVTAPAPIATTYPINPFGQGSYPGGATITPQIPLSMPSSQQIDLSCLLYCNDGSTTIPTAATLTINGPVVG